ncbi:MAG: hypothetical protein BWY64_03747 [bacterium ADurb.Bin363]|nr:MAG: hypothetical protein BWY64_03747 [bacterium ADurb.Bin363]
MCVYLTFHFRYKSWLLQIYFFYQNHYSGITKVNPGYLTVYLFLGKLYRFCRSSFFISTALTLCRDKAFTILIPKFCFSTDYSKSCIKIFLIIFIDSHGNFSTSYSTGACRAFYFKYRCSSFVSGSYFRPYGSCYKFYYSYLTFLYFLFLIYSYSCRRV